MTIADYFEGTLLLISLICLGFLAAILAKAETPFLKASVAGILLFEAARNAYSAILRRLDPQDFGAESGVLAFSVMNTLLIVFLIAATVATLRLSRPTREVEEKLSRVEGKQDADLEQQEQIIEKLEDLETKVEGDKRRKNAE